MTYTRKEIINMILQHLNIRLSFDKLYENYTNKKYHKKIVEYNKGRDIPHYRNPWALYMDNEPLPDFIPKWEDCDLVLCCPLGEECERCI